MRRLRPLRAVLAVVLAALTVAATEPARASAPESHGLTVVASKALSPRLVELTFHTAMLPTDTHVRILVPAGYARSTQRYPVVYLFNGGGGSYLDWIDSGGAEALTATTQAIFVMPDGGTGGNYTDWYGVDQNGFKPRWETYHLTQLLPWVDDHLRTLATRNERAVAGLSMGGNGALHYAGRHPDLFVAAASFSGANDVFNPTIGSLTETTGISDGVQPGAVFGPEQTELVRWHAFNPPDLATNLRSTWVSLAYGNGQPGGPGSGGLPVDPIEQAVHACNVTTHDALSAASVTHLNNDYGAGNHSWYYWSRDLTQALPKLMAVFAQHRPAPTKIDYSSIDRFYGAFGWSVNIVRPVVEWSRLSVSSPKSFTLAGTGTAVIATPRTYAVGQRVRLTTTDATGKHVTTYTVGADKRVKAFVDLGAPNAYQEYTPMSDASGTTIREAHVVLS